MVLLIWDFYLGSYNVDLTLQLVVDPLYFLFITKVSNCCYKLCGSEISEEGKNDHLSTYCRDSR